MKLINLFLAGLNILILPNMLLAESSRPAASHLDKTQGISQTAPTTIAADPEAIDNATSSATEAESDDQEEAKNQKEATADQPTPEAMARLRKLATADQLYLSGYKSEAKQVYRQVKENWQVTSDQTTSKSDKALFDDPQQLSPAGRVFWRNYQQGKTQGMESKVISALNLLTTREPEFISGHIHYAQMLKQYERGEESVEVLEKAIALYPDESKLVQARVDAHVVEEEWLDASILSRQFALFNPELPETQKFQQQAKQYLEEYQSDLRSDIALNAVGNAIVGTVGFALTGSLFGPLSALETTSMLIQGESAIGEATVRQARQQLPLLEDPLVTEYIDRIGQKVATASGRDDFDYEFHLIMDDSLNAFALPGGKVFVHAGAIMHTDTEAELAGLLAHEVAHSALSHGFQLVTRGNLTANVVSHIPYIGNAATSLIVMNYSRGMERQADIFGTRILVNSGYAADGVRNLMVKLHQHHQDKDNPEPAEWLSTHPNSKERIRYMEQLIVDRNLNRFAYEGVAPHQNIKYLVQEQWQQYEQCINEDENFVTIEMAKECAANVSILDQ